jgi:hypothetical protein
MGVKTYKVIASVRKLGTARVEAASQEEADRKADALSDDDFDWHWPDDGDFYVASVEEEAEGGG